MSYTDLTLPSDEELHVVKAFIARYGSCAVDPHAILKTLYEQRVAFPDTYALLASVTAFGYSTAVCESSFSTLSRIDTPHRRAMTVNRLQHLTLLAFEKDRTRRIDLDKFIRRFADTKTRRIQLF